MSADLPNVIIANPNWRESPLELPKPEATEDAALFLWAASDQLLSGALELIDAWGFTYKTIAWAWLKLNPDGVGIAEERNNPEHCLLAVRGRMPVKAHDVTALIIAPYDPFAPSVKPSEQFNKIARLYPGCRWLVWNGSGE